MHTRTFLLLIPLLLVGCAREETFQLLVKNNSSRPCTVWLTKDGPPSEAGWTTPEQLAIEHQKINQLPGVMVPSGEQRGTGSLTGHFDDGSSAILRVYVNITKIEQILATSRESSDRIDLKLRPGFTTVTLSDKGGKFTAQQEVTKKDK